MKDSEASPEAKQSPPAAKQTKLIAPRNIPTATVLPETKRVEATTAVVRPVLKKTISVKPSVTSKIEDIDEDELLADSPSPPDSPKGFTKTLSSGGTTSATSASNSGASGIFSNRRVIVRNSDVGPSSDIIKQDTHDVNKMPQQPVQQHKGIFDRLDKKVIGVNEAAKRKIQRIVINNSE